MVSLVVTVVMGCFILSEIVEHLDPQDGTPHPVTADLSTGYWPIRLRTPRSGLERSDFVHWP